MKVELYDTTLRDGSQREGISLTVKDKISIARKIDELGVQYIEGGWPGSNPKDAEFFARAGELNLGNAKLVAFGSTCRPKAKPENDSNLLSLVSAGTGVVNIVAKGSDLHVLHVLKTELDENLRMIRESIKFLKSKNLIVFIDVEHAFDG
jgi:2-isopropylmalate synthase